MAQCLKKTYYRSEIESKQNDSKGLWSTLKTLLPGQTKHADKVP